MPGTLIMTPTFNRDIFVNRKPTVSVGLHAGSTYQAMIDADLLGFVYHYGLKINGITAIRELPPFT